MTQKDIISELARELAMRRKVWARIPQTAESFVSTDHQRQYDALKAALEAFQTMYAAEFLLITNRVARLRDAAAAQTEMKL